MDRDDSTGSSTHCDTAFVKIEPLKHKKPAVGSASPSQTKPEVKDAEEEEEDMELGDAEDKIEELELPPLLGKIESKPGSRSPSGTTIADDEASRADSERSYNSDADSGSTYRNVATASAAPTASTVSV